MIPEKFTSASLTDDSMMLSEPSAAFFTRAQNPENFDAWAAHIRENWTELPFNEYLRPESKSEKETA